MGGQKPTQSESVFLIGSVSPINRPYLFLSTNHHLYAEIRTIPNSVQDRLPVYGAGQCTYGLSRLKMADCGACCQHAPVIQMPHWGSSLLIDHAAMMSQYHSAYQRPVDLHTHLHT